MILWGDIMEDYAIDYRRRLLRRQMLLGWWWAFKRAVRAIVARIL